MEKQVKLRIDLVIWDLKYCTYNWLRVPHIALAMSTRSHSTSSSPLQEEMANNVTKQYESNQNMSYALFGEFTGEYRLDDSFKKTSRN